MWNEKPKRGMGSAFHMLCHKPLTFTASRQQAMRLLTFIFTHCWSETEGKSFLKNVSTCRNNKFKSKLLHTEKLIKRKWKILSVILQLVCLECFVNTLHVDIYWSGNVVKLMGKKNIIFVCDIVSKSMIFSFF